MKSKIISMSFSFIIYFFTWGLQAQTLNAQDLHQKALVATCANCHGTNGKGVENSGLPLINHYSGEQILTHLKAYKSGAREGTIMPQLAKGYTDEQLQIIANLLGKK